MPSKKPDHLKQVFGYHDRTKHHLDRYAISLGYMDWATQPDPFRRFEGAPQIALDHPEGDGGAVLPGLPEPRYDALFQAGATAVRPVDRAAVSELFYYSLAISAWKRLPGSDPWALRVNPSSGNLHPTEGYLVADAIEGLGAEPAVYHYAPSLHGLEERLRLAASEWRVLAEQLPRGAVLVGLTSIYWREAWKYGERAFRYCNHDVGHAIGAVAFAAARLGWRVRQVAGPAHRDLARLLGVHRQQGIEAEQPDCLLALWPAGNAESMSDRPFVHLELPETLLARLTPDRFTGEPNQLSSAHHQWPIIEEVAQAVESPGGAIETDAPAESIEPDETPPPTQEVSVGLLERDLPAGGIIRQRRSAVAMDGRTAISRELFFHMLLRCTPWSDAFPFDALPWTPRVALALFVHRVDGLEPGLYLLVRHPLQEAPLRHALREDFLWRKAEGCPDQLALHLLAPGDCRQTAQTISCHQAIASQSAFALGMLAHFEEPLTERGASFYPRLFWETGLIGQVLYLEAEAGGVRSTGIGCFLDDTMHSVLGIEDHSWQSLYHFALGGPLEDGRLQTIPSYQHLEQHRRKA